jgi:hypothetical protein
MIDFRFLGFLIRFGQSIRFKAILDFILTFSFEHIAPNPPSMLYLLVNHLSHKQTVENFK